MVKLHSGQILSSRVVSKGASVLSPRYSTPKISGPKLGVPSAATMLGDSLVQLPPQLYQTKMSYPNARFWQYPWLQYLPEFPLLLLCKICSDKDAFIRPC